MSPKVPKAYLEARRGEILAAAHKCFVEKGFHYTTMQDIYRSTNLSPGAVYNYFSSKEDIVIAALKEFNEWSISSMTSLISENPSESLLKFIRFWLSLIKQNDIIKSFSVQLDYYSEATRNSSIREVVLKSQDATHTKLIEFIKQHQRAGMFNAKLDPLAIARAMMGMVFGIAVHKLLDPEVDLDAYGQVCVAMIKGTFSSPPKKRRRVDQPISKRHPADKD
jgi:AcrR family transcriptional regulator